jgi:ribulose-phosphate 3-epimerase
MKLIPSLMCADFLRLGEEIEALEAAGADMFHLDVMDGDLVPNLSMGLEDVKAVKRVATIPCDLHFMASHPRQTLPLFLDAGVDIVYVHPEMDGPVNNVLLDIAKAGRKCGIVVDPGVSFSQVEYSLPMCDYVLIMTVNPGFAGQKFLDYVEPKIKEFVAAKERYGYEIMVDGACSPEVVKHMAELGCDGCILGTSALFGKDEPYDVLLGRLRDACAGIEAGDVA